MNGGKFEMTKYILLLHIYNLQPLDRSPHRDEKLKGKLIISYFHSRFDCSVCRQYFQGGSCRPNQMFRQFCVGICLFVSLCFGICIICVLNFVVGVTGEQV